MQTQSQLPPPGITAAHCRAKVGDRLIAGARSSPFYYYDATTLASEGSVKLTVSRVASHPDPQVDITIMFFSTCAPHATA